MTRKTMIGLVLLSALMALAGVEVRVRQTPGGPQIHVDGAPVAPRFFFGVERSGKIRLAPEWRTYAFDISPEGDVPGNGTFHIRFGLAPELEGGGAV